MATPREGLTRRRAAMGFTQEALAEHLGIERSTVGRWERGELTPHPLNQPKLARALKVSLETLGAWLSATGPPAVATSDRRSDADCAAHRLDLITVAHLRQQVQNLDGQYDRVPSTSLLADAGPVLGEIGFVAEHAPHGRTRLQTT